MIFAKKSLGQNFLKSEKALSQIVDAGDIQAGDTILEIGPGEGALTVKILEKRPAKLIIVEKDDRLISSLTEKFGGTVGTKTEILHGDILDLLNEPEIKTLKQAGLKAPYKIIANIPYYITGTVIRHIFELDILPEKVVLLLQKEVADRIVAIDKKESLLSLSIKLYGKPKRIAVVPRGAFAPAPNVDSAIILIDEIEKRGSESAFFEIIKAAFAHKRKRLAKNLDGIFGKSAAEWENALVSLGFGKNIRAEDIPVEKYKQLARQEFKKPDIL